MIRTIWVTWVTFLEGQVGLIYKLNYLDVTRISHVLYRSQCWHLVSVWTLGLMNALKHHWCETSLLSQAVWSMWCPKILSSTTLCKGPVLYPAKQMKKSMALFHINVMLLAFLKKIKLQHVGNKLCGSHSDCSVGQWVKWINRYDPLSTLIASIAAGHAEDAAFAMTFQLANCFLVYSVCKPMKLSNNNDHMHIMHL